MNSNNDKNQQKGREEEVKIYGAPGSTLQTPEEHRHDQSVDPRQNSSVSVSRDDLRETDIDKLRDDLDSMRGGNDKDDSLGDGA